MALHTVLIKAVNAPGVLPRILIVLAHRRLVPVYLHLEDNGIWAMIEARFNCPRRAAELALGQLRRIVEVRDAELGAGCTPGRIQEKGLVQT